MEVRKGQSRNHMWSLHGEWSRSFERAFQHILLRFLTLDYPFVNVLTFFSFFGQKQKSQCDEKRVTMELTADGGVSACSFLMRPNISTLGFVHPSTRSSVPSSYPIEEIFNAPFQAALNNHGSPFIGRYFPPFVSCFEAQWGVPFSGVLKQSGTSYLHAFPLRSPLRSLSSISFIY